MLAVMAFLSDIVYFAKIFFENILTGVFSFGR